MSETTHARISFELEKADTREEVLGLSLGAASSCWEKVEDAGVFDSSEAGRILGDALSRLSALDKPNVELATTQELLAELGVRFTKFQQECSTLAQSFLSGTGEEER